MLSRLARGGLAVSVAAGAYAASSDLTGSTRRRCHAKRCCSLPEAHGALEADGLCIVGEVYTAAELQECCAGAAACRELPTSSDARSSRTWRGSSLGRYHRIDFCNEDVAAFERLEQRVLPLVEEFFGEEKPYRSELQLLTATPESSDQIWHSDNRGRGLTLVLPLGAAGFSAENGATQLLPGSHHLAAGSVADGLRAVLREGPRLACAPLGSVVAYDARTYHRGTGNASAEARPCLVLRYDARATPPPGVGMVGTFAHSAAASVLHVAAACAVRWREGRRD